MQQCRPHHLHPQRPFLLLLPLQLLLVPLLLVLLLLLFPLCLQVQGQHPSGRWHHP
jgi:hypothetical protein